MSDFDEWLAGLRSDDYDTVVQSAAALGRSGDHRAVEPLLSLLTDESRFDASRSCAAEALGELGELAAPEASGALHACIESRRAGLADEEWPVLLVNCAVALAKYGDHSAAGDVVDALRSPILTARSLAADGLARRRRAGRTPTRSPPRCATTSPARCAGPSSSRCSYMGRRTRRARSWPHATTPWTMWR